MSKEYLKFKRIFVIVADSLGVGEARDAEVYNDKGADTLGHIAESGYLNVPFLEKLGFGFLDSSNTLDTKLIPSAYITKLCEESVGKDTLTGHFELMGLKVTTPFPAFTDTGFPQELIDKLKEYSGRDVIGNISASGTEIIKELGKEQLATGALIVYTSADSVLQIAANEEIIPLEELYDICKYARKITLENKDWMVGRIIARPFVGKTKDTFTRTTNRHDYAVKPFSRTLLDELKDNGYDTIAVGKIYDIFDGCGITECIKTKSNHDGMIKTIDLLNKDFCGLCFVNLVDFDALYGHRRDTLGYASAINEFDKDLSSFVEKMNDDDLVIVVADHGNDPTHHGTDHTRENVPMIAYYKGINGNYDSKLQKSFATVAKTIAENFKIDTKLEIGTSIFSKITEEDCKKKEVLIKFDEKITLHAYEYNCLGKPKGIIQICHGMCEHLARYDKFAEYFVKLGYKVVGCDQFAHGKTAGPRSMVGHSRGYDFMDGVIKGMKLTRDYFYQEDCPYIMFSHSMGSMALQRYIQLYPNDCTKAIISATDSGNFIYKIAPLVTKPKNNNQMEYSDFVHNISFGKFNNKFKDTHPYIGWLCQDDSVLDDYLNDDYCGIVFPKNYYYSLTSMLNLCSKTSERAKINKDLQILITAGMDDPVGRMGKGPKALYQGYKKLGLNAELKLYPHTRHEIHSEPKTKDEFLKDLSTFISK